MNPVMGLIQFGNTVFDKLRVLDFLGPLVLRLYLAPVFWMAGSSKIDFSTFMPYQNTVSWFGNPDWGLGLPLPGLMAFLAGWSEVLGAIFLLTGFAVRWISIPLIVTMLVAIFSVHLKNGWLAIASGSGFFATDRTMEAVERLARAKEILREHGNYDWLTEHGNLVVLNNGIEFAVTYLIMLLVLFFIGAGKYLSVDYWLKAGSQPR
jgi:uncharacterized membrane protein YphA (DoxX/SURF4 family)